MACVKTLTGCWGKTLESRGHAETHGDNIKRAATSKRTHKPADTSAVFKALKCFLETDSRTFQASK